MSAYDLQITWNLTEKQALDRWWREHFERFGSHPKSSEPWSR